MKMFFGIVFMLSSLSAYSQNHLKYNCERTRAGCDPVFKDPLVYKSFNEMLVQKLPLIGKDYPVSKFFGIAIKADEKFTLVKCTEEVYRVIVSSCAFEESESNDGLNVVTPLEFLNLLGNSSYSFLPKAIN